MSITSRVITGLFLGTLMYNTAIASDLVVVESRGTKYTVGEKLNSDLVITLEAGQRLNLINENGDTIRLKGPVTQKLTVETKEGSTVVSSLGSMISTKQAGTATLGVVRSGTDKRALPETWVVDVENGGNVCIIEGQPLKLYKENTKQSVLKIQPADRNWGAVTNWAENTPYIMIPYGKLPIKNSDQYVVDLDGVERSITFHIVPSSLNDNMKTAWLINSGCEAQSETLTQK